MGKSTRSTLVYYGTATVVTALLTVPVLGLLHLDLGVPISYSGDALATAVHVKDVLDHGWIGHDSTVGAPWGQHTNDFPGADNLHLGVMLVLGLLTTQWAVVLNGYFLLSFPLSALTAAWAFRRLGVGAVMGVVLSALFAFAPYHFLQGEPHLYLSSYYPVPFAVVVLHRVLTGVPLWDARVTARRALSRLTWHNARLVAGLALVATGSSYYGIFTLLVGASAAAIALVRDRSLRRLVGTAVAGTVLLGTLVANMLPNLLYERAHGANPVALARNGAGTEVYALKLSQLLLPWSGHRIGALAALRHRYDTQFPLASERPALGLVAAVGLVLLGVRALSALTSRATSTPRRDDALPLAGLVALLLLWSVVGGFATLFALFVSDELRGWNRLVIFLCVVCLAAVGRELESSRVLRGRRAALPLVSALVLAVGLYDQTPPPSPALRAADVATWHSDEVFARHVQALAPRNGVVFQLPYMFYPESRAQVRLADSDEFRPALASTSLRWTYGGIRGRALSDWPIAVTDQPLPQLLGLLGAAHVAGICVARRGYADDGHRLEAQLATALHEPPVVSDDGEFSFFDLRASDAEIAARHDPADLALVGARVVAHPVAYPLAQTGPQVSVLVDNPLHTAVTQRLRLVLTSLPGAHVHVRWPDGARQSITPVQGIDLDRTLDLPPGRSQVTLSSSSPLLLVRVTLDDPVLEGFVP